MTAFKKKLTIITTEAKGIIKRYTEKILVVKLQFTSKGTERQNVNSKRNFPNHNCPETKRASSCRDEFPVTVILVL